jgi:putative transposase
LREAPGRFPAGLGERPQEIDARGVLVAREDQVAGADVLALRERLLALRSAEKPGRNVAAKAGLNRVVLDAGFGLLDQMIVAKAESAARTVIRVDARFSSQECSRCGHVASESRRRRR